MYGKVDQKRVNEQVPIFRKALKEVYDGLIKICRSGDGDKSVEVDYKVGIKDGVKIVKGSTEALIHELVKYTSDKGNKKLLYKTFEEHMDDQREVDDKKLKVIFDINKIESNKEQRKQLLKILDYDTDGMVSLEELKKYIDSYDKDVPLSTNILAGKGGKKKNMLNILKEVCVVGTDIKDEEYFRIEQGNTTTILNSDHACMKRCEQILEEMKQNNQKRFYDKEFGPKNKDDFEGSKKALYSTGEAPRGYVKPEQIEWYWPEEYADGDDYMFVSGDASSNEVLQGALGDCWFIGALSVLAARDDLLIGGIKKYKLDEDFVVTPKIAKDMSEGVYPPIFQCYFKYGIYVFKFFKNFEWRYVIIDGRLPCYKANKQPVFGRCKDKKELWVPLIEKAYAKLHCCYESLISGFIDDGLTDLTGFVAEKLNLHNNQGVFPNKKLGTAEEFWDYLNKRAKEFSMMGCARKDDTVEGEVIIDGEKTGILSRHAYGLLDVFNIKDPNNGEVFDLLRIRNPWGKTEWNGEWSDHSEEIEKYQKELEAYIKNLPDDEEFVLGEEDGTFLISFKDWSSIYNKLYVAIDFPNEWSGRRFTDTWDESCAGGLPMPSAGVTQKQAAQSWAKNPQYLIKHDLDGDVEFFFSLAQIDGRVKRNSKFPFAEQIHPVCLILYPCPDGKKVSVFEGKAVKPEWVSAVVEHKEVSMRARIPKGTYLVVPSTREPNQKGSYFLSVYFEADINDVQITNLTKPNVKGYEIKEEDEDVEVSEFRITIVQARMNDLRNNNMVFKDLSKSMIKN